jgi:beta-glucosidase
MLRPIPALIFCILSASAGAMQAQSVPPSNAELASPQVNAKVEALLKRMTLEEKIGQLVQYSATEAHPAASAASSTAALNVNPPGPGGIDSYALAQKGDLGSLLNAVGQALTNHFQHAAVDQTRLHIPPARRRGRRPRIPHHLPRPPRHRLQLGPGDD